VDWGECGYIEIDGKTKKLYCFTMILGYSRMRYAEFTLSIDVSTLIQCHLNAFTCFCGYPEEILYDNMKQVVLRRAAKSTDSEWNPNSNNSSGISVLYPDSVALTALRPRVR